jgi:hypothetical protein
VGKRGLSNVGKSAPLPRCGKYQQVTNVYISDLSYISAVGTQLYTSTFVLEKDASLGENVLASNGEENIQSCTDGLHDD